MAAPTTIHGGAPARLAAVVVPVVAVGLIGAAAAGGGLDSTSSDFVPPWLVAAVTLVGAGWLSWRLLTQFVELDDEGVRARNVSSTVRIAWDQIESLTPRRRLSTVGCEVVLVGLRRRIALGALTRFEGEEADRVMQLVEERARSGGLS